MAHPDIKQVLATVIDGIGTVGVNGGVKIHHWGGVKIHHGRLGSLST